MPLTERSYPLAVWLCHVCIPQGCHLRSMIFRRCHNDSERNKYDINESRQHTTNKYYYSLHLMTSSYHSFLFLIDFLSTPYNLISQIQYTCYRNCNAFFFQLFFLKKRQTSQSQYLLDIVVVWYSKSDKLGLWLRTFSSFYLQ